MAGHYRKYSRGEVRPYYLPADFIECRDWANLEA